MVSKVARHTQPDVLPIPVPVERFSHVHLDVVGPFNLDQGNCYLLTMIDRTTRWPEATTMPDTTTDTILQAFLNRWVARFGIPVTVTTDRGAQFTSEAWKTSMARLGVTVTTTTLYHPQANGLVERFHCTIKNALRCAVRASNSWTRSLPWVMLGLRNAPKLDTGTSTAEVVFGTTLRVPGICFQSEQSSSKSAADQLQLAGANTRKYSLESLDLGWFKASPFVAKSLRTAEYVYVRDDRLGKPSLAPRYIGPYKVREKNWSNNTFLLEIGARQDVVALARLKVATITPEAS